MLEVWIKVQQEIDMCYKTSSIFLANNYYKAIPLPKTTLVRKPREFYCAAMTLAADSARVARIKEHCLLHQQRQSKQYKAKGIKVLHCR